MTPILDYVPRLVEANLAHRLTAAPPDLLKVSRWWNPGVTLDQGQEGSCVGHGVVADYLASPVRGLFLVENRPGPYMADVGHDKAVGVYNRAKEIDEWEGVDYDGTSVRAGMLVARELGWITGFSWALNLAELRTGLESGPVVIGFSVTDGMWDTRPNGDWIPSGVEVGGHCALITGYSPNYARRGPRYRIRNSWNGWGYRQRGDAYISPENLDKVLFQAGGEAAVGQGRKL